MNEQEYQCNGLGRDCPIRKSCHHADPTHRCPYDTEGKEEIELTDEKIGSLEVFFEELEKARDPKQKHLKDLEGYGVFLKWQNKIIKEK